MLYNKCEEWGVLVAWIRQFNEENSYKTQFSPFSRNLTFSFFESKDYSSNFSPYEYVFLGWAADFW
jgi:hypothetical protein